MDLAEGDGLSSSYDNYGRSDQNPIESAGSPDEGTPKSAGSPDEATPNKKKCKKGESKALASRNATL